jgi:hypothetical protein
MSRFSRTALVLSMLTGSLAHADETPSVPAPAPTSPPKAARPAPSLPWLLRPTAAANVVRSDTVIGAFDGGSAVTTGLVATYKLRADLALGARIVFSELALDATDESSTALANPAIFALWAPKLGLPVALAFYGAFVAPLGQGAGADADPAKAAAVASGVQTRQGMDNALFATNYTTVVGGVGAAWVRGPVTVIGEATVLQLFRVRDIETLDSTRTNFTAGLHAGWSFWGPLTASAELHLQRWISAEKLLDADMTGTKSEQASWTVGLRGHWKVGQLKLRPGLSYSRGLDEPMSGMSYQIVQVDLPVVF